MRIVFIILSIFLCSTFALAKEYGTYDPKKILAVAESPSGKKDDIDLEYLDLMLHNLALHAKNRPASFDTPQDRQRAVADIDTLSRILDALAKPADANPEILRRAGFLNSMGHNMDIPGCGRKALSNFLQLLSIAPSDPGGNYMYGTFLASSGKAREALPYLKRALAAGEADASLALGTTYLSLDDETKALENLEAFRQSNPDDPSVAKLIDAIRNGKMTHIASGIDTGPESDASPVDQNAFGRTSTGEAEILLDSINARDLLQQSIGKMVDSQISQKPFLAPYRGIIIKFFEKYMPYEGLRPELAKVYSETFTESELKEINRFYSSPTGKRLLLENQEIMKRAIDAGVKRTQAHQSELERMLKSEEEHLRKAPDASPGASAS